MIFDGVTNKLFNSAVKKLQGNIDKVASKAWNYSIGTTGKYYRVFARMDGTKNNEPETLLISGGGNFANIDGLWAVSFFERPNSTRSFIVRELISSKAGNVKFGWYTEGNYRYFGMYTGNDYSSVPFITKLDGNSTSGVFHAEYGAFYLNETMPTGWEEVEVEKFAVGADLANYLPLDGTASMNGNLSISVSSALSRQFTIGNSLRKIMLQVLDDGGARLYDYNNAKNVINLPSDGSTYTFDGIATGNVPISNNEGRVETTGTNQAGMVVKNGVASVGLIAAGSGAVTLYDNTRATTILKSDASGRTFYGKATGQGNPVAIQSTAPTDTTALWVY